MHPGGWLEGVGRQLPQGTGHPQTVQSCFTIMEGVHSWSRQLGEPVRAGTGKKYERKHGGMVTLGHDVGTCCEESVLMIADWDIGMHWLYEQLCHSGRPHVKHGQDSLLVNELSFLCISSTFTGCGSSLLIGMLRMLRIVLSCSLKPFFIPRFAERMISYCNRNPASYPIPKLA